MLVIVKLKNIKMIDIKEIIKPENELEIKLNK